MVCNKFSWVNDCQSYHWDYTRLQIPRLTGFALDIWGVLFIGLWRIKNNWNISESFNHIMNLNNGRNIFYGCSQNSTVWRLFCLTFKNGFLSINLIRSWSTLVIDIAKMGSDAILLNFLESSNENIHAQCNSGWLKYLNVCKFRGSDI